MVRVALQVSLMSVIINRRLLDSLFLIQSVVTEQVMEPVESSSAQTWEVNNFFEFRSFVLTDIPEGSQGTPGSPQTTFWEQLLLIHQGMGFVMSLGRDCSERKTRCKKGPRKMSLHLWSTSIECLPCAQCKALKMQVECPLSEMFGTRSVKDFELFLILEYLYHTYWLSIPNPKTWNVKCSNERLSLRIMLALKKSDSGGSWMLGSGILNLH